MMHSKISKGDRFSLNLFFIVGYFNYLVELHKKKYFPKFQGWMHSSFFIITLLFFKNWELNVHISKSLIFVMIFFSENEKKLISKSLIFVMISIYSIEKLRDILLKTFLSYKLFQNHGRTLLMELVNRLHLGKEHAKVRWKRNKCKCLYFRFCDTTSSDEYDPYSDNEFQSEDEEPLDEPSNDYSEEEDNADDYPEVGKLDLQNKKVRKRILDNIIDSIGKGHAARFTDETKLFAYILFSKSPSAYAYLRKLFPFPSESILHDNFSSAVTEHKKDLTDITRLQKHFNYQKKVYNLNNEKIKCVLAVDAFAGTVIKKIKAEDDTDNCKHVFYF